MINPLLFFFNFFTFYFSQLNLSPFQGFLLLLLVTQVYAALQPVLLPFGTSSLPPRLTIWPERPACNSTIATHACTPAKSSSSIWSNPCYYLSGFHPFFFLLTIWPERPACNSTIATHVCTPAKSSSSIWSNLCYYLSGFHPYFFLLTIWPERPACNSTGHSPV